MIPRRLLALGVNAGSHSGLNQDFLLGIVEMRVLAVAEAPHTGQIFGNLIPETLTRTIGSLKVILSKDTWNPPEIGKKRIAQFIISLSKAVIRKKAKSGQKSGQKVSKSVLLVTTLYYT